MANLNTKKNKPFNQPSHYDYIKDDKNCFIGLFNLDTCNGGTVIENKKITEVSIMKVSGSTLVGGKLVFYKRQQ